MSSYFMFIPQLRLHPHFLLVHLFLILEFLKITILAPILAPIPAFLRLRLNPLKVDLQA